MNSSVPMSPKMHRHRRQIAATAAAGLHLLGELIGIRPHPHRNRLQLTTKLFDRLLVHRTLFVHRAILMSASIHLSINYSR